MLRESNDESIPDHSTSHYEVNRAVNQKVNNQDEEGYQQEKPHNVATR
jgi:hypothetical protein